MADGTVGDIFLGGDTIEKPYLHNVWGPLLLGAFGFGGISFANWCTRRPVFSGIQKHISATIVCGIIGIYLEKRRNKYLSERDAILRHYISLHPEDFAQADRKKFAEVLMEWIPIR